MPLTPPPMTSPVWSNRKIRPLQRHQAARPGNGHLDQLDGFLGGGFRFRRMHPGALVSDISQFEEVLVQSRLTQCFAENRLVSPRRAGSHDNTVETVLANHFFNILQTAVRAGEHGVRGEDDIRLSGYGRGNPLHIHDGSDVPAAVADENPDAGLFIGDIVLIGG